MRPTYIVIHADISTANVTRMMAVISEKLMAGFDEFHFLFSTSGGEVAAGLTLFNFLRGLPVPISMHNIGNVDSIGNSIFVAAPARFASQHSTFMFHGVGSQTGGGVIDEKQASSMLASILANQQRISSILTARTRISEDQARDFFREAVTISAQTALELRLIHEIRDLAIPAGADVYTIMF